MVSGYFQPWMILWVNGRVMAHWIRGTWFEFIHVGWEQVCGQGQVQFLRRVTKYGEHVCGEWVCPTLDDTSSQW